jgi:hypothetical protein
MSAPPVVEVSAYGAQVAERWQIPVDRDVLRGVFRAPAWAAVLIEDALAGVAGAEAVLGAAREASRKIRGQRMLETARAASAVLRMEGAAPACRVVVEALAAKLGVPLVPVGRKP